MIYLTMFHICIWIVDWLFLILITSLWYIHTYMYICVHLYLFWMIYCNRTQHTGLIHLHFCILAFLHDQWSIINCNHICNSSQTVQWYLVDCKIDQCNDDEIQWYECKTNQMCDMTMTFVISWYHIYIFIDQGMINH